MGSAKRILIVEDEEILADNLRAYLERSSCVTQVAADGASAIELAQSFEPQCLVLDYRLPDMDGFAALDCIRQHCGNFPCVLMTGHPTGEVYDGAARRGIEHILFKPFPLSELSGLVLELASDGALALPAPAPADEGPIYPGVERRRKPAACFPLRLFDGSWLRTDRRHPEATRPLGKGEDE